MSLPGRLLGFVPLFVSTCHEFVTVQINCTDFGNVNYTQDIRILNFSEHAAVDEILNPVAILFCVYVMALVSSLLLGPQVRNRFLVDGNLISSYFGSETLT